MRSQGKRGSVILSATGPPSLAPETWDPSVFFAAAVGAVLAMAGLPWTL